MSKYCEICERGVMSGNNVSHSNRKTRRIWAPNIQKIRIMKDGAPVNANVCTRCIRSCKVERA